ncbi:MAG: lysophospholipid acyltransferase family protein [Bacteroidota bacterium]
MNQFYYIFLTIARLISLLPFSVLYVFSDFLYILTYYLIGYRKKVVMSNLENAFPEKSGKEIELIAQKFYKNFCDLIIEVIKSLTISEKQIRKRFLFINREILDELYHQNKSVIAVQGHCFNWEWTIMMGPKQGKHKRYVVYKPLSNKFFDNVILDLRSRFETEMILMYKTYDLIEKNETLLRSSKKDTQPSCYQFGADQTPMKHKAEYWTNFLNQDTPVFLGAEKIAKEWNIPVVFLNVQKVKRGYYEVEFIKLFDNSNETSQFEITEKHVRVLEEIIIAKPENWLWSHRRWKHRRV